MSTPEKRDRRAQLWTMNMTELREILVSAGREAQAHSLLDKTSLIAAIMLAEYGEGSAS